MINSKVHVPVERGSLKRTRKESANLISHNVQPSPINISMSSPSTPSLKLSLSSSTTPLSDDNYLTAQVQINIQPPSLPSKSKVYSAPKKKKMQYITIDNKEFLSSKNMSIYRKKFKSIQKNYKISGSLKSKRDNKNQQISPNPSSPSYKTLDYQYKLYLNKLLSTKSNISQTTFSKLIIIDFDDTLFPTSSVSRHTLSSFDHNPLFSGETKTLYYQLKDLIDTICSLFDTITSNKNGNGKIIIVSNAAYGWIDGIFNGHFGGVIGRLFEKLCTNIDKNNIEIRSARDEYLARNPRANRFTFDGQLAKTQCIQSIMEQYYDIDGDNEGVIPIIYSIGDGMDEFHASRIAWNNVFNSESQSISILERIKFLEKPTLDILIQELETIESLINDDTNKQFMQWIIDEKYVIDYV